MALILFWLQYTTASTLLLQSVQDLKASSTELQSYARRLERLEMSYKELASKGARNDDLLKLEKDTRNLIVRILLSR